MHVSILLNKNWNLKLKFGKKSERKKFFKENLRDNIEHPEFNQVVERLENGNTLIVMKLYRLAKNTREILEIV